jgi:hypothetical protein
MQSQNREVVTVAAMAIAPIFLKSPLGSKIFPLFSFSFLLYIERWRMAVENGSRCAFGLSKYGCMCFYL